MSSSSVAYEEQDAAASVSVADAAAAASAAALPWARLLPTERAELLEAVADAIDARTDELVAIAEEETHLATGRLQGEVARTTSQLRLFGQVLRDGAYLEATVDHADSSMTPPRPDLRRQLVPIGPVAVFTASNFPFAFSVAGGDTASALAAGCPVVVKAHSGHLRLSRRTARVVQEALRDAGAPEGTLTHVEGRDAGKELVTHPAIRAVGFTGSLSGGRALFDLAVSREDPIPFYGELSALNPVVVTPGAVSARAQSIAEGLTQSFTLGVGQFCTKPGVVFVPADGDLTDELRETVAGTQAAPMLMERMVDSFQEGVEALSAVDGVEIVAKSPDEPAAGCSAPLVLATDVGMIKQRPDLLLEEKFGPAAVLVRYRSREELLEGLEQMPGSLTASLHAEQSELNDLSDVLERLEALAGRLIFDGWPTGVAVTWAMQHGGPWPSTTNALHTSVGTTASRRFMRPVSWQNAHPDVLPPALREDNPLGVPRRVDGELQLP